MESSVESLEAGEDRTNAQADPDKGSSEAPSPSSAGKKWYVVHTYSGYEEKARQSLEKRVGELRRMAEDLSREEGKAEQAARLRATADAIGEVLVPIERVQELGKGGQRKVSSRKFFPGYIFVNMVLTEETWHVVRETPKITGFVGQPKVSGSAARFDKLPDLPEVPDSEVREITQQMAEGALRPKPKVLFEVGEPIKVIDGPFQDFNGTVEEVRPEKGKVRVLISIFGRATPVELDFVQVEKS